MESTLEREMRKWQDRERRFREDKIFSPEVLDGPLLKEKLAHFNRLNILYKPTVGSDQLDYKLLQAERRKIQRKLYPSLFLRLFAGIVAAIKTNRQTAKLKTQSAFSTEQLKSNMVRSGFSEYVGKAIDNMKLGRDFTLPVSYYVNEKERMDFELSFKRGSHGEFKMESYKAMLKTDTGEKKEQTFPVGIATGYNADQAYHLLSGRSIHNKENGGAWQQLDFNDKDAEGNYRFKAFPDQYHNIDYFKVLSELPHAPGVDINLSRLIHKMENGQQVTVPLIKDGIVSDFKLQINPQHREIGIYDASGSKVNLNARSETKAERNNPQLQNKKSRNRGRAHKVN